jgi:hypothetical protein
MTFSLYNGENIVINQLIHMCDTGFVLMKRTGKVLPQYSVYAMIVATNSGRAKPSSSTGAELGDSDTNKEVIALAIYEGASSFNNTLSLFSSVWNADQLKELDAELLASMKINEE